MKRRLPATIPHSIVLFLATQPASVSSLSSKQARNGAVKVFYDSSNNLHRDMQYHPEQSARIDACVGALKEHKSKGSPRLHLVDVSPVNQQNVDTSDLVQHEPFADNELDYARKMLVEAHSEGHVGIIERRCRDSRQRRIDEGRDPLGFVGYIDDDTYLTTESYDVFLRATAAWIRAVDAALGRSDRGGVDAGVGAAMALTRPPGHHATSGLSNGFCVFNFAAAAALHAVKSGGAARVSVLDWDVHYGQGVADILQHHEQTRYVSLHQTPAFPYQGEKRGLQGEKENVLTVPVAAESTWTCGYRAPFEDLVLPFVYSAADGASQEGWEPDLVIVCAGYDALDSDELASCSLIAPDYGKMTRLLRERIGLVKGRIEDGPEPGRQRTGLVIGLEGGYQLKEGAGGGNLADAVLETIKALY